MHRKKMVSNNGYCAVVLTFTGSGVGGIALILEALYGFFKKEKYQKRCINK